MLKVIGRVFKRFIQFLMFLFVLLAILLVYCLYYLDPNDYKDLIVKQIEQTTGSKVQLKGDIKIRILPEPHVALKDSVFTIKMNQNDITFISNYLDFDLALKPLLKRDIRFNALHAEKVKIILSQNGKTQNEIAFDKFKGKIEVFPSYFKLSHFTLTSMNNTLHGSVQISPNAQTLKITGDLFADSWSFIEDKKSSANNLAEILQALSPFEIDLAVKMNHLNYDKTHFRNVKFNLISTNNNFTLAPTLEVAQGKLAGNIRLQSRGTTLNMSLDFKLQQAEAKEVLNLLGQNSLKVKGKSDLEFRGNTMGNTLTEWQSGLSGILLWRFQEVRFEQTKNNPFKGEVDISFVKGVVKNIKGNFFANSWQFEEGTNGSNNPVLDLLSSLAPYKLSLGVKVNNMQYKKTLFKNVQFLLTSEKNIIKLNPIADFANGKLASRFTVRPAKENTKIDFTLNLKNADAPDVINNFGQNKHFVSGKFNFDLKGNTIGNSMTQWKANFSGNMLLNLTKARLHPNARQIIQQLGDEFNCIVMKSKINEGIINGKNNLGFRSSSLSGLGSGQYDLKTNQLNYIFQMVTNNKINLNLGGTLHTVRVTGTLQDPVAKITSEEMMRQGSRIALGIVTGGYSLLVEKLQDVLVQRRSPCQVVLEGP